MTGQAERLREILAAENTRQPDKNKIITFSSGKGGTGKTFISVNIAHVLAYEGYKVLFVDFDSNLSNADILLNLTPKKTIVDYFTGRSLFRNTITKGDGNVDYVFGDSGRVEYPRVTIDMIARFINDTKTASEEYDFVVIDTGAGLNNEILHLLSKSFLNVFVTTPEPTAIMDTYAVLKLLKTKSVNPENYVLVNMCDSENQAIEAYSNLNTALSHFLKSSSTLLGYVSYDALVRKSIIDQNLFFKTYPKSELTYQLRSISTKLAGSRHLANINQG